MKHVRVRHDGEVHEGTLADETIRAGETSVLVAEVDEWLSPVLPSKIIATHLTYRSRAVEYQMVRLPQTPSYFMKPPSSLSGHLATVTRPAG